MKKILSIAALSIFLLGFTSCKKDYTCECTVTSGTSSTTESRTITDTKKDAEAECNEGDETNTVLGVTSTTDCELK